jgi:hypothetical protein
VTLRGGAVAGLTLFVLAGCGAVDETAPARTPVPRLSGQTSTPSLIVASASASPSGSPTLPVGAIAAPRTMRFEPGAVKPFACPPPAPERPEVIVGVEPVGPGTAGLVVKLEYGTDPRGDRYQGIARMPFDAARKVFAYRLPALSRANLSPDTVDIVVTVRVELPVDPRMLAAPAPFTGTIPIVDSCPYRQG